MVGIVKFFGWFCIVVAVVIFAVAIATIFQIAGLLPLGAGVLLSGALLVVFARIVELLQDLNNKIEPISAIAQILAPQYKVKNDQKSKDDVFSRLPPDTKIIEFEGRRVARMPDGSVLGDTNQGPQQFGSLEEYRRFLGS